MKDQRPSLQGRPVVTAEQMAAVEKLSVDEGASAEGYMIAAGKGIADCVSRYIDKHGCDKDLTLLVGKGNNGGDAFVVGAELLSQGYSVQAYHLFPTNSLSALSQKQCEAFCKQGGKLSMLESIDHLVFPKSGVVVDGLLGTGFTGEVQGLMLEVIQKANESELPIVAIDIPSGVSGNDGHVSNGAIHATLTVALGAPKLGYFVGQGYNMIGELCYVDFGMASQYYEKITPPAYLINEAGVKHLLPHLERTQHKYEAGYVLAIAGSPGMPGAAVLATKGALRSGAGIVRLFSPEGMEHELANAPDELLRFPFSYQDPTPILGEEKRAGSCLIGPGIGRLEKMGQFVRNYVQKSHLPLVIDADGLWHLKEALKDISAPCVLTPHRQEMAMLLGQKKRDEKTILVECQQFVDRLGHTLILKGAPTFVFSPKNTPLIIAKGDRGMATAGSGDVLAGVVATFLAKKLPPIDAALLAVYLHGVSGEIAAKQTTSYSLIATDIIEHLPDAIKTLISS